VDEEKKNLVNCRFKGTLTLRPVIISDVKYVDLKYILKCPELENNLTGGLICDGVKGSNFPTNSIQPSSVHSEGNVEGRNQRFT
jgi:hypothetical protein